eukprot:GHVU01176957.1.p1 GENE.GHVU01176957.1~~GHVU01176957.1.p1  ORF type:complete len:320 (+),score=10.12 GHVU01176957.1:126-962(+)
MGAPKWRVPPTDPHQKGGTETAAGNIRTETTADRTKQALCRQNGNTGPKEEEQTLRTAQVRAVVVRKAAEALFPKDCPKCLSDPEATIVGGKCRVCSIKVWHCTGCGLYVVEEEECPVCPEGGSVCECKLITMHQACACSNKHPFCATDGAWVLGDECVVCATTWECPECHREAIGAFCEHCKEGNRLSYLMLRFGVFFVPLGFLTRRCGDLGGPKPAGLVGTVENRAKAPRDDVDQTTIGWKEGRGRKSPGWGTTPALDVGPVRNDAGLKRYQQRSQ